MTPTELVPRRFVIVSPLAWPRVLTCAALSYFEDPLYEGKQLNGLVWKVNPSNTSPPFSQENGSFHRTSCPETA
jgi:hypothetical protein